MVHGGQAVVDGSSPVLVKRLTSRLSLQVAVFEGLHHRLGHLPLNLGGRKPEQMISRVMSIAKRQNYSNELKSFVLCKPTCSWAFLDRGA